MANSQEQEFIDYPLWEDIDGAGLRYTSKMPDKLILDAVRQKQVGTLRKHEPWWTAQVWFPMEHPEWRNPIVKEGGLQNAEEAMACALRLWKVLQEKGTSDGKRARIGGTTDA